MACDAGSCCWAMTEIATVARLGVEHGIGLVGSRTSETGSAFDLVCFISLNLLSSS